MCGQKLEMTMCFASKEMDIKNMEMQSIMLVSALLTAIQQFCQHIIIITPYEVLPSSWDNSTLGATARHIHHVQSSGYCNYKTIHSFKLI